MLRPLIDPSSLSLERSLRAVAVFAQLADAELAALGEELEWMSLPADATLFEKGGPGDSLFVTVSGRLEAFDPDAAVGEQSWGRIAPGELVGEMAILTGATRRATVRALRDSILLRLTKARFLQLVERHPALMLPLSRLLLSRIEAANAPARTPTTRPLLALAPVTRDAPVEQLARALGTGRSIGPAEVEAALGASALTAEVGSEPHRALIRWLQELEAQHDTIVLRAEAADSAWTQLCLRQADTVVLVANARSAPGGTAAADRLRRLGSSATTDRHELVLVHPDATALPSGTRRWLQYFPVDAHHHVRLGVPADLRRLARFLTGRATALALSGGAARGFAHVGVLRALQESNTPVDLVCGTSMGALFGGLLALGWRHDRIFAEGKRVFVDNSIFDVTLPLLSVLGGKRLERFLDDCFGTATIEDLWLRYFCMASSLARAQPVTMDTGSAAVAIRASSAVPGLFAPVLRDGELLVDGLFLDNLPAELARQRGGGKTIAVNVIQASQPNLWAPLMAGKGGLRQAMQMMNPFKGKLVPPIMELVMQCFFLGTVRESQRVRDQVDLYIEPHVADIGFVDSAGYEPAAAAGYHAARDRLRGWQQASA